MQILREIRFGIWFLIGLNLMVTFGAIALLTRMSPALERVMNENVYTTGVIEEMLAVLAENRGLEESRERFLAAFKRAQANITVEGEAELLMRVQDEMAGALKGERAARDRVIAFLRELGSLNRGAMAKADGQVRRLGQAGAWAVAFLGLFTFWAGAFTQRAFRKRIADPVIEISSVLSAWRQGEILRRCRRQEAPMELARTMMNINSLLDDEVHYLAGKKQKADAENAEILAERTVMQGLLEKLEGPAVILNEQGAVFAANQEALNSLSGDNGTRIRELLRHSEGENAGNNLKVHRFENTGYSLCQFKGL